MAHVPHLHVPGPWDGPRLALSDEQLHHLTRVLRRADSAPVSYTDGAGLIGEGNVVGGQLKRGPERQVATPVPVHLAVAPPRAVDRCRWIVEKLQELGVTRLTWLGTRHGEGRPPKPDKALRWAVGALEQSRGAHLLVIDQVAGLTDLPPPLAVADQGGRPLSGLAGSPFPTVAIGPEGGWAPGEVPAETPRLGLVETVLRTETAAVAAAVVLKAFPALPGDD